MVEKIWMMKSELGFELGFEWQSHSSGGFEPDYFAIGFGMLMLSVVVKGMGRGSY